MPCQFSRAFLSTFATTGLTALLFSSTNSGFAAPVPALSADSFVDSIGVNVHLTYDGTPYERFEDLIKPKLKELGIRHIRDGAYQEEDFFHKVKSLADDGIKTTLIFSGNPPTEVIATANKLTGAVEAIEGPNESDLEVFNFTHKGDKFPEGTRKYQKEMFAAVKNEGATKHLPVVLPSMGWGENADKMGKLNSAGDYCNLHSYPNIGQPPTIDLDSYFIPHIKNMCGSSLPMWATETGYHNVISNELGISDGAAGKYIPRLLLGNFKRNIERTYLYELVNQSSDPNDDQSNFGLLRFDGSPKPAFTAIKNMNSLLKDSAVKFTPQSLDYEIEGDKQGIETVLLQKSNGDYYLILWQETKSWDNDSKKDINVPNKKVKVSLKNSAKKLETYDPTKSISALNAEASAKAIDISVPDYPVILRIDTNGTQRQPLSSESQKQPTSSGDQKSQPQPSSTEQLSPSATPPKQSTSAGDEAEVETSSQSESVEQLEPIQAEEVEN